MMPVQAVFTAAASIGAKVTRNLDIANSLIQGTAFTAAVNRPA